jgi:meiotically up-regulated gene 157 (Mug157) protein
MEIKEEIVGERLRLSDIHNRMNEEEFEDLRLCVEKFKQTLQDEELKEMFDRCFFNTLYTTTFFEEDGSAFIITGDIPAMWLRDSSAQVMQYLFFADKCESVKKLTLAEFPVYVAIDCKGNSLFND